jgi:GNAT superfamily N-acetyltransferase|tara:strand:+ start:65 stop:460 length:396 start_codon:yes stop_codon:yes gene_type:complete
MKKLLTEWRKYLKEGQGSDFGNALEEEFGVVVEMGDPKWGDEYEPHIVPIDSIVVPKEKRGQGIGSQIMERLIDWADENNYILGLDPSSDFGSSVTKLRKFYGRFGFVRNLGRKKDYRTRLAMIRYPGSKR